MKKSRFKFVKLVLVTLVVIASVIGTPVALAIGETFTKIAGNETYGCRRTFGGGLYDSTANKTWVCWSGPQMDIYVREYNHATNSWGTAVKVADVNTSGSNSYHNYPVMEILPDGKLAIFYAIHSNNLHMVKAPNVRSISGTWTNTVISNNANCYPMPIVNGSEIYVFYSRSDDLSWPYRSYRYIKSTDNGSTWTSPVTVIDSGETADKFNEVYAFGICKNSTKLHITWTMAGGPGGHNDKSRNLYHAYFNTTDSKMYNAANTDLGTCIDNAELSSCIAYSAEPSSSYKKPIQYSQPLVQDDSKIVIGFQHTDSSTGQTNQKFVKYSSGSWTAYTVATNTERFLDITKVGSDDFRFAYMSANKYTLYIEKTVDGGATWTSDLSLGVPYDNNADTINSGNFITNGQSNIQMICTTYDYETRDTDYSGVWPVFTIGTAGGEGGSTLLFEGEDQTWTSSDGTHISSIEGASGGQYCRINADAAGDYGQFYSPNVDVGTYTVKVGIIKSSMGGKFKLMFGTQYQGAEVDTYASTPSVAEIDLGTKSIGSSGSKLFKFDITGKNPSSSDYDVRIDYVRLIPN